MKYGIREICDVVFKAKKAGKIGGYSYSIGQPVLYIDSAKTSTLEGTASTVYATGGRGNSRLIAWEGEKTLTFTVEDALLSEKGFAILSGAKLFNRKENEENQNVPVHQFAYADFTVDAVAVGDNIIEYVTADQIRKIMNQNVIDGNISNLSVATSTTASAPIVNIYFNGPSRTDMPILLWEKEEDDEKEYLFRLSFPASRPGSYSTWKVLVTYMSNGEEREDEIELTDETVNFGIHYDSGTIRAVQLLSSETYKSFNCSIELATATEASFKLSHVLENNSKLSDINTNGKYPIFMVAMNENSFCKKLTGKLEYDTETSSLIFLAKDSSLGKDVEEGDVISVFVDYYSIKKPLVEELIIDAGNFADNYYVEAKTSFRRQADGKDADVVITFPNVKIQSNFTFNMAATGDPSTFSFVMDALPGATINNPNKNVLCEMLVIDEYKTEENIINSEDSVIISNEKEKRVVEVGDTILSPMLAIQSPADTDIEQVAITLSNNKTLRVARNNNNIWLITGYTTMDVMIHSSTSDKETRYTITSNFPSQGLTIKSIVYYSGNLPRENDRVQIYGLAIKQ